MRRHILLCASLLLGSALGQLGGAPIAAGQSQSLKVGKTGVITIYVETKAGDLTLRPGRYFMRHMMSGEDHFIQFTEVTKPHNRSGGGVPIAPPVEIKCRLVPLEKKVRETKIIYAGPGGSVPRIDRVLVAGENVAHVF